MKSPTHIYVFDKSPSVHDFEIAKQRTKNKDFEKLDNMNFHELLYILEKISDHHFVDELGYAYAAYNKNDFVILKLSNINPIYVFEYNDKFMDIVDEAYKLYSVNDKIVSAVLEAASYISEYCDIDLNNLGKL